MWKRTKKGWYNEDEDLSLIISKRKDNLYKIIVYDDEEDFGSEHIEKYFKSKSQAFKFARAYMRKH